MIAESTLSARRSRSDLAWLLFPATVFVTTRLFSGYEQIVIGGDQCKYLELGRSFPRHLLYNNDLYMMHPPLWGWSIGLVAQVVPLQAAGLMAALAWAGGYWLVTAVALMRTRLSVPAVMAGLLYLALNHSAIVFDTHVSRMPVLVCLMTAALFVGEQAFRTGRTRLASSAGLLSAAASLASDQALALLPCFAVQAFAIAGRRRPVVAAIVLSLASAGAAIFPLVRWAVFANHQTYPAGIDGIVEVTRPVPWIGCVQPNLLPETTHERAPSIAATADALRVSPAQVFQLFRFVSLPRLTTLVLLLPLTAAAIAALPRDRTLWLFVCAAILCLPGITSMQAYYGLPALPLLATLVAMGIDRLLGPWRSLENTKSLIAVGCVIVIGAWLSSGTAPRYSLFQATPGRHFLLHRAAVTRGAEVAAFLADMPADAGVMAPVGLVPELAYQTSQRLIAIPASTELLDAYVSSYGIDYIVVAREAAYDRGQNARTQVMKPAIRDILSRPQQFRVVATLREPKSIDSTGDEYLVFEVLHDALNEPKGGPGHGASHRGG